MVSLLRPLEMSIEFEDRPYKLGETIDVAVHLEPRNEVDVREARVDLLCEERYTQTSVSWVPDTYSGSAAGSYASGQTKSIATERKETFVYSSFEFLKDTKLEPGGPGRYRAPLVIELVPPPHAEEAKALQRDANSAWSFKWKVVASVNVARGRDPKRQRAVTVIFD